MKTWLRAGLTLVALCLVPTLGHAQTRIDFDDTEGWRAEPGWLANSAERHDLTATDGVGVFQVQTPGKGMKWVFRPRQRISPIFGALVMRYRAQGLATQGPDYALWLQAGASGQALIAPRDLKADGEWHVLAVDLTEAPLHEAVEFLAVGVYATDAGPARLELDYLHFDPAPPAGAQIKKLAAAERRELPLSLLERADEFAAHHDWLSEDADDGHFSITSRKNSLIFAVDQPGRGMKWSLDFEPPLEREGMRYLTVRYRAQGIEPYPDYFIYLGSEAGGMPPDSEQPLRLREVTSDDRWHTETIELTRDFAIAELALQVRAASEDAAIEIERIVLSTRRPLVTPGELVELKRGWEGAKLAEGEFQTVDLAGVANADASLRTGFWGLSEWIEPGKVAADGIPFTIADGEQNIAVTELGDFDDLEVALGGRASEILLLMFAKLPEMHTLAVSKPRPLRWLSEVEALVFDVRYADGSVVTVFPRRVPGGEYRVGRQLGVYQLPADRAKQLAGLTLREGMKNAEFALAAVTLNTSDTRLLPEKSFPQWQVRQPLLAPEGGAPAIERTSQGVEVRGGRADVRFAVGQDKLTFEGVRNTLLHREQGEPGDLLRLRLRERELTLADLRLVSAEHEEKLATYQLKVPDAPLSVTLTVGFAAQGHPELSLGLRNTGQEALRAAVTFPALGPLNLSKDLADDWYLYPKRGTVLSNQPVSLRYPHGGQYKLQFTDLYSAETGGGIYFMTDDLEGRYGYFYLDKGEAGTEMGVEYQWVDLPPGEKVALPSVVIGAHKGDWHEAFRDYRTWVHGWYKPMVPRKQWFREVFSFRQGRLRHGLLDFDARKYDFEDFIERDRAAFGCMDYLHIFDWSETKKWGRVGDYDPWEEIPGPAEFRAAVEAAQAEGVPVGLYLEGYLVNKRSRTGQAHGAEWTLLNSKGEEYGYFSTPENQNWNICAAVPAWQEYMERTYARVAQQTGAMGLYIDEYGFGSPGHVCYNAAHDHPNPMPPVRGERELTRRVRAALPADRVLYTEEVPDPVTCQYQDGAFCYSAISSSDELAPSHLELMRFVLPDFKVFQLNFYCAMRDGNWNRVKRPFFNGDGWWLQGDPYASYDDRARALLKKCLAISHEYADCFTTMYPQPLVATLQPGLFANQFPTESRTLWTLYNATYTSIEGPALAVKHIPGARYYDVWNDRELTPEMDGQMAVLRLRVDPHDLGCVVQTTK